jgi:hypothetical protein
MVKVFEYGFDVVLLPELPESVDEDFAFGKYLVLELKKDKNQRVKNASAITATGPVTFFFLGRSFTGSFGA